MKKEKLLLVFFFVFSISLLAQKKEIEGEVFDEYLEIFNNAKVKSSDGTVAFTNQEGKFKIKINLPNKLIISFDGFENEIVIINSKDDLVNVILKQSSVLDNVIVSGSRIPEKIFESPVDVDRMGLSDILNTPSENYYNGLVNLKEVTNYNNSRLIQVMNTRGFTNLTSKRMLQLVDGIDTFIPFANMSIGSASYVNDIDVENVEVLMGAASALYGASAFNGLILINTKTPFDYQGVSIASKAGVNTQKSGNYGFYNLGTRFAYAFDKYFAAKVSFSVSQGEEWDIEDYRNSEGGKIKTTNTEKHHYNGVNVYGDKEIILKKWAYAKFLLDTTIENFEHVANIDNAFIDRTGYKESSMTDHSYNNRKFNAGLYYRPFGKEDLELIFRYQNGNISSVLQSEPSRYRLDDSFSAITSLELKSDLFSLKAYHSAFNKDKSYNINMASDLLSYQSKSHNEWVSIYVDAYENSISQGKSKEVSHELSRIIADKTRLMPGSTKFKNNYNNLISSDINKNGAKITDYSSFNHIEGNFNFDKYLNNINVIAGFSFRDYVLNSKGTIYTDYDRAIHYNEYGFYSQVQKKFLNERLKLTGSIRYDNSKNLDANFSFRTSALYLFGHANNQNLRLTCQSAFRNPSIQKQYLGIQLEGHAFKIGNVSDNLNRFKGDAYDPIQKKNIPISNLIHKPGFIGESYEEYSHEVFRQLKNNDGIPEILKNANDKELLKLLRVDRFDKEVQSEHLLSTEIGYRSIFKLINNTIELDANVFFNLYTDFITDKILYIPTIDEAVVDVPVNERIVAPNTSNGFTEALGAIVKGQFAKITMPVNSNIPIYGYGSSISARSKINHIGDLRVSYSFIDYSCNKNLYKDFKCGFNTPKHTIKLMFGNKKVTKNIGFNVALRWQSGYKWESRFMNGYIDAHSVLDAQVNYRIQSLKSTIKIGANNLFGNAYYAGLGSGEIGNTYFVSWVIN